MGAPSVFPPSFPTFFSCYCTRFFPGCKYFFSDFPDFFENFFPVHRAPDLSVFWRSGSFLLQFFRKISECLLPLKYKNSKATIL